MKFYILSTYMALMSIMGFISMGWDKRLSQKRGARRVPEKSLLIIAILGGAPGSLLGMEFFRHKTKHKKFSMGLPIILIAQLAGLYYLNSVFRFLP